MSSQIIDPKRYKKTTRKKVDKIKSKNSSISRNNSYIKQKTKINESYKFKNKAGINKLNENMLRNPPKDVQIIETRKANSSSKKEIKFSILKVAALILCIGLIGIVSKMFVNNQSDKSLIVNSKPDEKITLVQDYDLKIGMSNLDTIQYLKSKNIVLNELVKLSYNKLVNISKEYSIEYEAAKKIEKINNKEYLVEINPEYNITVDEIIKSIETLKTLGNDTIYSELFSNILSVSKNSNTTFVIKLKNDDSLFTYKLTFPIVEKDINSIYNIKSENDSVIKLTRNKSTSTLNSISFKSYNDSDELVSDFRNNSIDVFTATSDSIIKLIGKHEYNVKKYRDGQTIFLLGNKDSSIFKIKEARQALAYSLNREQIVKDINSSYAEVIDIPFIYSQNKYKYDTYGASNVLLNSGWQKSGAVFKKKIENEIKVLEFNLLVNEEDKTKLGIADHIKDMAGNVGIKININKQKGNLLKEHIDQKKYDILLADVYINEVPDINFIKDYININDEINSAINIVNDSSTDELSKNILNLQTIISNEVACIGILAKDTSLLYQKNINGFNDIGYMKIFSNIDKIGKIQDIKSDAN